MASSSAAVRLVVAAAAAVAMVAVVPATATTSSPVRTRTVIDGGNRLVVFSTPHHDRVPAILYVHGGAWWRGRTTSSERRFAASLARRTGWVVAALDYPTTQPRRQVEPAAVARAMARLRTMPGVDRRRVVLWGESAGAHLALLTAMTRLRSAPGVAAVVSVSGPTDLRTEYASGAQVFLRAVRRFEQMTPVDAAVRADDRYTVTSPVAVVPAAPPPVFQAVSVLDPLVPTAQVSELARVLDRRGVEHRTVLVAGTAHGLDLEAQRTATGAGRVDDAAIAFVRHALGR